MTARMLSILVLLQAALAAAPSRAELPPVFKTAAGARAVADDTVRTFVTPKAILWRSDESGETIADEAVLLENGTRQPATVRAGLCTLKSVAGKPAPALLLDFGVELHGGLQLVMGMSPGKEPVRFRLRLGESVTEAMSEIGGDTGATNDHAMRDLQVQAPWLGSVEVGNSGFRFARIDLVDADRTVFLKEVNAIFSYRDVPYLGSFKCSDERLNRVWATGAYTVHLNMQHYLWDGIKRDRLVWIGDMHPETSTICSVFGPDPVVPASLDYARDTFPLPGWMNGISSYSMWWVIIHHQWYRSYGDLEYLRAQKAYLVPLLKQFMTKINDQNEETLDGRFLDWPSSENKPAIHAGLQSLMVMTMDAGAELCALLDEPAVADQCRQAAARLRRHVPDPNNSKQAAALMALSGLAPAEAMNRQYLAVDGARRMSTFYGFYILEAMAAAGNHQGAIDCIRQYWGAMLDLGATTFWEDFDLDWTENAGRIDQFTPEGKKDIHADFGNYCYKGLRHSLCHGWASGPTAWMSRHVLGIRVLEPGGKRVSIEPHLADLQWAEGTFPTSAGVIHVRHEKQADGTITTSCEAPEGVRIDR
ncbi:MAG: alpha-L-rhamnosidase-related protein [Thermoguttaceae bacterium]